ESTGSGICPAANATDPTREYTPRQSIKTDRDNGGRVKTQSIPIRHTHSQLPWLCFVRNRHNRLPGRHHFPWFNQPLQNPPGAGCDNRGVGSVELSCLQVGLCHIPVGSRIVE